MTLRILLTDGNGVQGLTGVFGAYIQTNVVQTAADAAAALASATAAAASASSATASATSATASASSATASATSATASQAAALASQNSAATSASSATGSASAASASASAASTSAANALVSQNAAATSAANAAATLANALTKANNLSDVANAATAAHNLGLGTADTPTFTNVKLSGSTAHALLVGQAGSGLTFAVPSTAGKALISAGASADPVFGFTTGALIGVQVFTGSGTYTPTAGTNSIIAEMAGGGAGSAGYPTTTSAQVTCSQPGGTGAYVVHRMTSGFSGMSVVVGAAGTAGASGGGAGGNGGNTTIAAGTIIAGGGVGGTNGGATTSSTVQYSSGGGTATGGNIINASGVPNDLYSAVYTSLGLVLVTQPMPHPRFALQYGFGALGLAAGGSTAAGAGRVGGPGVVIIYEYA